MNWLFGGRTSGLCCFHVVILQAGESGRIIFPVLLPGSVAMRLMNPYSGKVVSKPIDSFPNVASPLDRLYGGSREEGAKCVLDGLACGELPGISIVREVDPANYCLIRILPIVDDFSVMGEAFTVVLVPIEQPDFFPNELGEP